jgi:Flp pilus assembly protein TadD
VLDPAELDRVGRMSVCAACHLQGDARIELEPGRVGPPVPGGDLLEERAVFVAAEPTDEIGFVSHVERLVLSRCYLESEALACDTCHDPHRSLREPNERVRVRRACESCHAGAAEAAHAPSCSLASDERPAERDCASCHMRTSGVFDVAGVAIHDHWIRTRPGPPSPRGPLRFPESSRGDWKRFAWPGARAPEHFDDPGLWMMALAHGGHFERALGFVDREPGARVRALPMYHHVRGSLLERAGRPADARAAYVRARELDPELAESDVNLGPLLAQLGEPRAGLGVLDRLLAKHPLADGALRNRALVRLMLGDEPGFLADLEAALRLLPDPAVARALASACEQRGDAAGARRWSAEARRLDPRGP